MVSAITNPSQKDKNPSQLIQLEPIQEVNSWLKPENPQVISSHLFKVGDLVQFTNPDRLEGSRVFERISMTIRKILAGVVATCELPDGSEQSFSINTLILEI